MPDLQLESAIEHYASAITSLEDLKSEQSETSIHADLVESTILEVLVARDVLQTQLSYEAPAFLDNLKSIHQLDRRLENLEEFIAEKGNLEKLRKTLRPQPKSWWWFPKRATMAHPQDRLDWAWNSLSILSLTISLGLFTNIATRLFIGGPDAFGAIAIAVQGIIGILGTRGALTLGGQEFISKALEKRGKQHWYQEVRLALSLAVLGLLVGFYFLLPWLSDRYTISGRADSISFGRKDSKSASWGSAQSKLNRAIILNPDNQEAHYSLGALYEKMQMPDRARSEYYAAAQGGVSDAYNNLAHFEILDKRYPTAVALLYSGLRSIEQEKLQGKKVEYTLRKNLGWVRLKQDRYEEAKNQLEKAIQVQINLKKHDKSFFEKAAAYCLLAQVFEISKERGKARSYWEACSRLANEEVKQQREGRFPIDEDEWLNQAGKCLKLEDLKKHCLESSEKK